MKENSKTKQIVLVGLLAALVCVGSALRFTIPISFGGTTSFHLGNIMCALSGILLGPWGGALASGIGSAIYDMTNPLYISEAWITFLFKGAYGLVAGLIAWGAGRHGMSYRRNTAATVSGAVVYAALYLTKSFFYDALLVEGLQSGPALATIVAKVPATAFNAVIAIVCAPALAAAISKARRGGDLSAQA